MENIKVSVIIPVYNGENYINKCLDSVLAQTLKEIEIIIVDDNSTDSTSKILEEYIQKGNKITVIKLEKNNMQGHARNIGIKYAKGKYIGFIDSDDYIEPKFYEKLYNTAEKYQSDIASAGIITHKKYINKTTITYNRTICTTDIQEKIKLCADTKKNFFYVWNKIYKTEMLNKNNIQFSENCIYEDVLFSIKALYYSNAVVSVPKVKYHYIKRKNSTLHIKDKQGKKQQDLIFEYEKLQTFCNEKSIILPERLNYYVTYWYNPIVKTYIGKYQTKDSLFGFIPIKKQSINYDFPIDMVYLWVDGKDPAWREKKQFWQKQYGMEINEQAITDGRFEDNEELKYSLRSLEKYASWINKIYIVTDNQIPAWLNTNHQKIKVVFHKDIIPQENLPLFNSEAIESYLPYIPGLSNHFIYGNDDMYLSRYVDKTFFFTPDGYPIVRLKHQVSSKYIKTSMYTRSILNLQKIIRKTFGKSYPYAPHHNIDAYYKPDFLNCIDLYKEQFSKTMQHKFRTEGDIQRVIVTYYALAINHGKLKHYSRIDKYLPPLKRLKMRIKKKYKTDSIVMTMKNKNPYSKLNKYKPALFCTNDGEGITNFDRQRIKIFLEETFPEKSSFEL